MYDEPSEYDYRAPTHRELVDNYTRCHGEFETERAWILSPYDTWEPNPFFVGSRPPHPESCEGEKEAWLDAHPITPPRKSDDDIWAEVAERLGPADGDGGKDETWVEGDDLPF